jgi:hypothetical protein
MNSMCPSPTPVSAGVVTVQPAVANWADSNGSVLCAPSVGQELGKRKVCDSCVLFETASHERLCSVSPHACQQLPSEARLTNPGLTIQQHHPSCTAEGLTQAGIKTSELRVAPYHSCGVRSIHIVALVKHP